MTWNTRKEYHRLGVGNVRPLTDKLDTLMFGPTAPARTIIRLPANLTVDFRDQSVTDGQLLTTLMDNFFDYGRRHWSWTSGSPPGVADGGLVKGNVNFCACGGFNDNFAYLATRVLGIDGVLKGNATDNQGKTWYRGSFVTMPTDVIDSNWRGGLCSKDYSFADLRMFKFTHHFFCNYHGVIFDATANATHTSTRTMVAFDLDEVSTKEAAEFNGPDGQVYEVKNVSADFQGKPYLNVHLGRWILTPVGRDVLIDGTNNDRGFTRYLITNKTKVGKSDIEKFTLKPARTTKHT